MQNNSPLHHALFHSPMRNDIFIDNNIAIHFANPLDPQYKNLIAWLKTKNSLEEKSAYLVVSQKLLVEYNRSSNGASSNSSIPVLINILLREGRLIKITNEAIKKFRQQHFTKNVERGLRSNEEDREHIPVVLLSDRKFALTIDKNLTHDLENFPGFRATVAARPEQLPYAQ